MAAAPELFTTNTPLPTFAPVASEGPLNLDDLENQWLNRAKRLTPSAQAIFKTQVQELVACARKTSIAAERLKDGGAGLSSQAKLALSKIDQAARTLYERNNLPAPHENLMKLNLELDLCKLDVPPPTASSLQKKSYRDMYDYTIWRGGRDYWISTYVDARMVTTAMEVLSWVKEPKEKVMEYAVVEAASTACQKFPKECAEVKEVCHKVYQSSGVAEKIEEHKQNKEAMAQKVGQSYDLPPEIIRETLDNGDKILIDLFFSVLK